MIRRLARCIREYKWAAILSPLCMIGEVTMEVLIPLVMRDLYDYGIELQHMEVIVEKSILLVLCALASLCFGVMSAIFASRAGTGFARNLRHDMFYRVQKFSFSNIDKFSSASIVTRLTSDVANLQMTFQMMIRMAIRCPMMLVLAFMSAHRISPELSRIYLYVMPVLALALIFGKRNNAVLHFVWLLGLFGGISTVIYASFVNQNESFFYLPTISGLLHHSLSATLAVALLMLRQIRITYKKWHYTFFGFTAYLTLGAFLMHTFHMSDAFHIAEPLLPGTPLTVWVMAPMYAVAYGIILLAFELVRKRKQQHP